MEKINAESIQKCLAARSKKLLRRFCEQLSQDSEKDIFDDRVYELLKKYEKKPGLIDYIRGEANRVHYSQSRKEYAQLSSQIESFCKPDYTSFRWNRNYKESKRLLIQQFKKFHLKSLVYKNDADIRDALPKETTHSGWSYILTGLRQKGRYMEGSFETLSAKIEQAKAMGTFNTIVLPGVRTQCANAFSDEGKPSEGDVKHKTRLVSMIDVYVILAELIWAKPFQEAMSKVDWYAGGKTDFDLQCSIGAARNASCYWNSLDYSKYDQSISSWLIEDAFEIIKCAFDDFGDAELFDVMKSDFINKVIIDGDGVLHQARKGVPSGSMFTQIVDSIVNYLMVQTYFLSIGEKFKCFIMGDDNLIFTIKEISNEEICSYLTKNFGIVANDVKSTSGRKVDDPEFLSRFWTRLGPWRHPYILGCKLMFPEKFRNYKQVSSDIIVYSYILAYTAGMRELIDVDRFLSNHSFDYNKVVNQGGKYLPGYLGYVHSYGLMVRI